MLLVLSAVVYCHDICKKRILCVYVCLLVSFLERDNTWLTMLDGIIDDGELTLVVSEDLGLDLHLAEGFATLLVLSTMLPTILSRMNRSLRFVLTTSGFSMGGTFFLTLCRCFSKVLGLDTAAARHCTVHQLLIGYVQQPMEVHTIVSAMEGPLLFHFLCLAGSLGQTQRIIL